MPFQFQSPIKFVRNNNDNEDLNESNEMSEFEKSLLEDGREVDKKVDFPDLLTKNFFDMGAFMKLREISDEREQQYRIYDSMTGDIIISSALEMYADDASQYDTEGRLIWCESEDEDLMGWVNNLLDTLDIPKKLWSIYYNLAEYGDVYIRLFKKVKNRPYPVNPIVPDEFSSSKTLEEALNEDMLLNFDAPYEDYVEVVSDPSCVYDLVRNGKTVQYAVIEKEAGNTAKTERIELYPPDQFVHIYIENPHVSDKDVLDFTTRKEGDISNKRHVYQVRRGKSMLHDIYGVEKEIELLEDALLLNRVSRSAVTRLFNIEVGDMPKTEVRNLLRRVKTVFESKLSLNASSKTMDSYVNSSGLDNIVVYASKDGKGRVDYQTIGGDVDVKSLLDLDYFNDKRFGGLKIPKAFMGYEESLGANSGGTLTQMDVRYGRTIKRLQTCVVQGITDLVNFYLMHSGQENNVYNFTLRVVTPSTADDQARDERLQNRLSMIDTIVTTASMDPTVDTVKLFDHLFTHFISDSRILSDLSDFRKSKEQIEAEAQAKQAEDEW